MTQKIRQIQLAPWADLPDKQNGFELVSFSLSHSTHEVYALYVSDTSQYRRTQKGASFAVSQSRDLHTV